MKGLLFLLVLILSSCANKPVIKVDQSLILKQTQVLSSDTMEGREPGTVGDQKARSYIESEFKKIGLAPVKGKWQQAFGLTKIKTKFPGGLSITFGRRKLDLKHKTDFLGYSGSSKASLRIKSNELVFVGYGIQAPEYNWDDFKGLSLKDKILVFLNNDPSHDPKIFAGKARQYYGRWSYKWEMAAKLGAKGAIIIHTSKSAGYPWSTVQSSWTQDKFELVASSKYKVPLMIWLKEEHVKTLFAGVGLDYNKALKMAQKRDFRPQALLARLSTVVKNHRSTIMTGNVLGAIPGSDPELKKEWLVYTAHHDHLGKNKTKLGNNVYNGARDNALAVAGLFALARYFKKWPEAPKRSILFAAVGAEESGLLGSEFLLTSGVIPVGDIVANINLEFPGIFGQTRDVPVVGFGQTDMDEILVDYANDQNRNVVKEVFPSQGLYYRSDQFNFALKNIPALWIQAGVDIKGKSKSYGIRKELSWVTNNYHQVSDQVQPSWNLAGFAEDLDLMFHLGMSVADQSERPQWAEGSEFAIRGTKSDGDD